MITERGNVKYSEKICSTAKLSTTYPTHNNLEINLDFCGQSQPNAWDMAWTTLELKHETDQSPPTGVEVTNEQYLISLTFQITSVFQHKLHQCSNTNYISVPTQIKSVFQHKLHQCSNTNYISVPTQITSVFQHKLHQCSNTNQKL